MGLLDRLPLKKQEATAPPDAVELGGDRDLVLTWPGAGRRSVSFLELRDRCPCAECVEEGTGRKVLDRGSIPADIRPLEISPVGSYALKIRWSDGHDTGIYTWETLRRVSNLPPA